MSLSMPLVPSRLLVLTSLPAVDGTLFVLAASGRIATPASAVLAGLTVIAGTNAWLAAREEHRELRTARARWRLATIALASTLLALAAAAAGAAVGARVALAALPVAAGAALLLLAAETLGARVPRAAGLPLATWAIALGVVVEVALWTR